MKRVVLVVDWWMPGEGLQGQYEQSEVLTIGVESVKSTQRHYQSHSKKIFVHVKVVDCVLKSVKDNFSCMHVRVPEK